MPWWPLLWAQEVVNESSVVASNHFCELAETILLRSSGALFSLTFLAFVISDLLLVSKWLFSMSGVSSLGPVVAVDIAKTVPTYERSVFLQYGVPCFLLYSYSSNWEFRIPWRRRQPSDVRHHNRVTYILYTFRTYLHQPLIFYITVFISGYNWKIVSKPVFGQTNYRESHGVTARSLAAVQM
jgi:hypothetical protein